MLRITRDYTANRVELSTCHPCEIGQGQEESSGTEAKHQGMVEERADAYREAKDVGLENIGLGNLGVFAWGAKDTEYLLAHMDADAHAL